MYHFRTFRVFRGKKALSPSKDALKSILFTEKLVGPELGADEFFVGEVEVSHEVEAATGLEDAGRLADECFAKFIALILRFVEGWIHHDPVELALVVGSSCDITPLEKGFVVVC